MKKQYINLNGVELLTKCLYARRMPNGFIVPCGKCYYCRKKYARELAYRCQQEAEESFVYNILLTYDDEHLPLFVPSKKNNALVQLPDVVCPVLVKTHIQDFLKRLREHFRVHYGFRIRFLCVGEYGGKFHRPHYHMILFSPVSLVDKTRDFNERGEREPYFYINSVLEEKWRKGACDIEPMDNVAGNVRYLVTYLLTDYDGNNLSCKIQPPFRLMSRGRGLGYQWFDRHKEFIKRSIKRDEYFIPVQTNNGSFNMPVPRYYRNKYLPTNKRIIKAWQYYKDCREYENNLKLLNYEQFKERSNILGQLREAEQRESSRSYRERKIHENHRSAGRVFARSAKTRKTNGL